LKPQLALREGSMTVEIYGGYGEIGGNCVVVKDGDLKIVFDNGVRFQVLRTYYRGRIQPLGLGELRSVGAIPPPSVFEGADAVYISHFHLDHLGLLGALPPGTGVYVPSSRILEAVEGWYRRSPTWLAELPHRAGVEIREVEPFRMDEFGVTPIPVSHSAYPAYAFLFRGRSGSLFYSGDLRVESPIKFRADTISNIGRVLGSEGVDVAILEGTNVEDVETPISSEEFRNIVGRVLLENVLVMVSVDPLDFELFAALIELASMSGRTPVIASPKLVDTASQWLSLQSSEALLRTQIAVALETEKPFAPPFRDVSLRHEVFNEPSSYLIIQEPESFLEMLRRMKLWGEEPPKNSVAVLTTPEPAEAEARAEEEVLAAWLSMLGVQIYRVRFSGHYYPHELRRILGALKPRKVVPIHTRRPRLMEALIRALLGRGLAESVDA